MPVMTKEKLKQYREEAQNRYAALMLMLEGRKLKSKAEGCKGRSYWSRPENMTATNGSSLEIRIAVQDFQTILKEIQKLK